MEDKDIKDVDIDPEKYLSNRVKEYIAGIEAIAEQGTNDDATRLKAHVVLLNKILPDRTKMDLDIKNSAPYDILKKQLEGKE